MEEIVQKFYATLDRMSRDEEFAAEVLVQGKGNPITLGPRVKDASIWVEDMIQGAKSRSKRWLENSLRPKKDPKKAALAAAGKYENKMRAALDGKHYDRGVENFDEAAREEVIKAVGQTGFERGIETHKAKAIAKVNKMRPLVAALAASIDEMPQDTDAQRDERMRAAKYGMIEIGKVMKGVK